LNKRKLLRLYQELLLDGIVPFWAQHGVDAEHGGVLSCMEEDGKHISTDKYIWSQARWVWVCSALYNRIEKRPEFLTWARGTIDFLLRHGRDEEGRWVFSTTREGEAIEGATSIYSDCFVIYGLSEYCRASKDTELLALAVEIFTSVRERIDAPNFAETAPYKLPPNRRNHGVPMILTEVASELAKTCSEWSADSLVRTSLSNGKQHADKAVRAPETAADIAAAADDYSGRVMRHFVRPERKCLLEFLDRNYCAVPPTEGTFVMPGHAIESMWFVMHHALSRNDRKTIRDAAEVMRWHLEKGWDQEYGGIFLGIDAEGHLPFMPNSDRKLWWPHTEALYALLLARELTGERWCEEWYERVHEWAFHHFAMPAVGEWRQRLDRKGNPITDVVALPVKDPFHLPRAVILAIQLLRGS
jgi:N-acylglucosamine 2-epimerase